MGNYFCFNFYWGNMNLLKIIFCLFLLCACSNVIAQEKQDSNSSVSISNYFSMSIAELMEQKVVTASKENEEIEDVPASVIIITKADIENYGYQSVIEILESTTGFFKHDDYRNVGFGTRGFFSNVYNRSFVLLVNGIDQSSPFQAWNTTNLTTLQVENIEKIEIIKGPMAVMYGNNAFFGAINIITKLTEQETSKSEVSTSYGADNTYRTNLHTSFKEQDFQAAISGGFSESEGRNVPFSPILDSVPDYSGNYYKNATTKNFFKHRTKYINAVGSYNNFYFGFSYDLSERNLIHNISPILSDQKNSVNSEITRFSLGYKKSINKNLFLDLSTQYHSTNVEHEYRKASISPKIEHGQLNSYARRLIGEARINYNISEALKVLIGSQISSTKAHQRIDVPPAFINQTNDLNGSVINTSVFTQINYTLSSKLEIIGGGRVDYQPPYSMVNKYDSPNGNHAHLPYSYSYDKPIFVPRIATIYKVNRKNILKAMLGQATSRSSISENLRLNNNPQPTLVPQRITTAEINYNNIKSKNLTFNSSIYYSYLNHLIVRTTRFNNGVYTNEFNNSGSYTSFGTDLQLIFKPTYAWLFDLSCTFQKTEDKKNQQSAAYSPNALVYIKSIYKFNRYLTASIVGNYVGSMETYWDETPSDINNPNSPQIGRVHETTPGYFNLSANVRLENLFSKGIFVALHAYNILDTRKRYAPTEVNYDYLPNGTYDQGIKLYANLGIKF